MTFRSNENPMFRSTFSEDIFNLKYNHEDCETWAQLCRVLVEDVCGDHLNNGDKSQLCQYMTDLKVIAGGRYIYYAGRSAKFFNNCFLLRSEEDTREDWANLSWKAESCLMTGGGIGNDYSVYRPRGSTLGRTGGVASGVVPKALMINEIGRNVIQGGSRRSAIYGSLNWKHGDINEWLHVKDWDTLKIPGTDITYQQAKTKDFNFHAPLDMTNISVNYDTDWLMEYWKTGDIDGVFLDNCRQALQRGDPGFSFNFFDQENFTLRNACTEVISEDGDDVCNLASLNFGRIGSLAELADIIRLVVKFLLCGTIKAMLPYRAVYDVRDKNRRLGLGIMGLHEWLLQRNYSYEVGSELHRWMAVYQRVSDDEAIKFAAVLDVSIPVAVRAIAPTGSIGILAGTTTGIEPLFAVAYKRRYLKGTRWVYQYVVDAAAMEIINLYGTNPDDIQTALSLANDFEQRIKFQADIQQYVDMGISSTINLPAWGTKLNNEDTVVPFANTLAKYAHRLRGFTAYPDGARSGQPLTSVPFSEAVAQLGKEFDEAVETHDVCEITGHGGPCGV